MAIDTIRGVRLRMVSRSGSHIVLGTKYSVLNGTAAHLRYVHNISRAVLFAAICSVSSVAVAQPDSSPPEWLQDAELTAVTFINADRGWAVGDRGIIWHTGDGGRTWKLQS